MITGNQSVKIEKNGKEYDFPVDKLCDDKAEKQIQPIVTSEFLRVKSVVMKENK